MSDFIDKLADAAENLVPPSPEAELREHQRWRLRISLAIFIFGIGLTAHIILACGFAEPFYSGFAQASDLKTLKVELRGRRARELQGGLLDTRAKMCGSTGEARQLYLRVQAEQQAEYFELTKRPYPEPPCEDFKE